MRRDLEESSESDSARVATEKRGRSQRTTESKVLSVTESHSSIPHHDRSPVFKSSLSTVSNQCKTYTFSENGEMDDWSFKKSGKSLTILICYFYFLSFFMYGFSLAYNSNSWNAFDDEMSLHYEDEYKSSREDCEDGVSVNSDKEYSSISEEENDDRKQTRLISGKGPGKILVPLVKRLSPSQIGTFLYLKKC